MVIGAQRPRLESIPAYVTSAGSDAIELGTVAGLYLDDWQQYVLTGSMGRQKTGRWSAFEVMLIVSRQNGKGSILEARELAGLYLISTDRLIVHTAHEHKTASEHYRRMWSLIENTPSLERKVARNSSAYGREFIELKPTPTIITGPGGREIRRSERARLIFIARSSGSGRGFTGDLLVYDEDMILDYSKVEASMPALSARPNPQVWYTGSAGLKTSTQKASVRRRGVAGTSKRLAFFEWSINWHNEYCQADCREHDDPDTLEAVIKSNPAYGIRIFPEFIEDERDAFQNNPAGYWRERLGVGEYPAPLDGWLVIPRKWFTATADNTEEPPRVTSPVFAIEVAPDRSSAAIAVAGLRPDGLVGIQVTDHREGTGWIVTRAKQIQDRWHPAAWVIDKRAATGTVITELERAGITVETLQASDVSHACGQIFDAFRDDLLRHYNQAAMRAAVAAVDKRKLSESWAFDRMNAGVDISPLMAGTFAYWGYQRFGVEADYDAGESVHFDIDEIKRLCRLGVYGPHDIRRLHDEGLIDDKGLEALANAGFPV